MKKILRKREIEKIIKLRDKIIKEGATSMSQAYLLEAILKRFPIDDTTE